MRGKGWRLARWRGEASCISQICRVIKLIKRLTHGGLVLLSVSRLCPLSAPAFRFLHRSRTADSPSCPSLSSFQLPSVTVVLQAGVERADSRGVYRAGREEGIDREVSGGDQRRGCDGRWRMIETRRGGPNESVERCG